MNEERSMTNMESFLNAWTPRMQGLLRIILGFIYLPHGTSKLFGVPYVPHYGTAFNKVELFSLVGLGGVLETVCGVLLLIGLFTRPAAFIAAGTMAVAYFMYHAPNGFLPIINKGDLPVVLTFVFLYFAFAGAGAWSVDAARRKA